MGRGRPPLECEIIDVQIHLRLREGRDDDLIAFFASLPDGSRASAVMAAMRGSNLDGEAYDDGISDDEMDDALMDSFVM